jgi:hypothetical protein
MLIQARIGPEAFQGGEAAYAVKCILEGLAHGCLPPWRRWNLPPLYKSGVRYRPDPEMGSGIENFRLPLETFAARFGDCDNLVVWRLAELWSIGKPASCRAVWVGHRMHVLIRHSQDESGRLEDPSIILGAVPS